MQDKCAMYSHKTAIDLYELNNEAQARLDKINIDKFWSETVEPTLIRVATINKRSAYIFKINSKSFKQALVQHGVQLGFNVECGCDNIIISW